MPFPPDAIRRLLASFTLATSLLITASHAIAAPREKSARPDKDRCVVLISVDGLANFYLDDPRAEMPTVHKLMKNGVRAEGMLASFPTVTWPNHTTMVTGVPPAKHGVLGNTYLDREKGEVVKLIVDPEFDKHEIVKTDTIYDAAHRAGLTTCGIVWPATRNAKGLNWSVPDMAGEAWREYATPGWLAELSKAGIPVDRHGAWTKDRIGGGVKRDWMYARIARNVLQVHSPNLVMIHLIEVDHVEHAHGPRSADAYWACNFANNRVREIMAAIEESPKRDKTTVIIVSDHGFFPVDKEIRLNNFFASRDLYSKEKKSVVLVSQGGGGMIYILDDKNRKQLADELKSSLAKIEGVEAVFTPDQFESKLGQFSPAEDSRAPDLWLTAKSGYMFSEKTDGEVVEKLPARIGTHGYLPEHPEMFATFIASGYGIDKGKTIGRISNMDVAPLIAELLGLDFKCDGKIPVGVLK